MSSGHSDATSDRSDFVVCFVYGAPGTGKSTLLDALESNADDGCPFWFAVVHEPTRKPKIARLIREAYKQDHRGNVDGLAKSYAFQAQMLIAEQRRVDVQDFVDNWLDGSLQQAAKHGKRLVVVFDGSPGTDLLLYGSCKHEDGLISDDQLKLLQQTTKKVVLSVPVRFQAPSLFVQLRIADDTDGRKHWHRVCVQRAAETERGVSPDVFARLARFADATAERLATKMEHVAINTDKIDSKTVYEAFCRQLLNGRLAGIRAQ